jgi:hypothetical protein
VVAGKGWSALGPIEIRGFCPSKKKMKNLGCRSGCVTNWYQSMVTILGLLGLMNELHRNSI